MICKKCGTEFQEGIFCPECGQKFEEEVEQQVSAEKDTVQNTAEQSKKKVSKPTANWKARLSLVFGIISILTVGSLIIPEIIGFILGITSKKGEKKYKKTALWGMGLSIISAILVIVVFTSMDAETSMNTNKQAEVVEQIEETSVPAVENIIETVQAEETTEVFTDEDSIEKEYEQILNSYTTQIYLRGEDAHMTPYEMALYIDGQKILSEATYESEAIYAMLELQQGTHKLYLVRYDKDKEEKSNEISFEVSSAYTNEIEIGVELQTENLKYNLVMEKDNNEPFLGYEKDEVDGQKIVRTASGKKIYYEVIFWLRRESSFEEGEILQEELLGTVQEVIRGEAAIAPEIPEFENYEFKGWSEDFSCVKEDLNVYTEYQFVEKELDTNFPGIYVNGEQKIEITRVTNRGYYFNLDGIIPDSGREIHLKNQMAGGGGTRLIYRFKGSEFGLEDADIAFIPNINELKETSLYIDDPGPFLFLAGAWERDNETSDKKISEDIPSEPYILPLSNQIYLSEEDVEGMDRDMIRLAINEIYARHGRIFQAEDLKEYFGSKEWYAPTYSQEEFAAIEESKLNDYEKKNIQFLAKIREQLN